MDLLNVVDMAIIGSIMAVMEILKGLDVELIWLTSNLSPWY